MKKLARKKVISVMAMLLIGSALLTACSSSTPVKEEQEVVTTETTEEITPAATSDVDENNEASSDEADSTTVEIEMPVIDGRYEYHFYSDDMAKQPIIGYNLPGDWEYFSGSTTSAGRVLEMYCQVASTYETLMIAGQFGLWNTTREVWNSGSDEETGIIDVSKNKEADVLTPFGTAEVYYWKRAYPDTHDSYDFYDEDEKFEQDGIKYLIADNEVATLTIGENTVLFVYTYGIRGKDYEKKYEGKLEELLPLLLEVE